MGALAAATFEVARLGRDEQVRQARAKGPGEVFMNSGDSPGPSSSARWDDLLTFTRDGDFDVLTLTGNAAFRDPAHGQDLRADRLKVWLKPAEPGKTPTAADFVFGLQLMQDDQLPTRPMPGLRLIAQAVAADAQTLVLTWKQPYILANSSGAMDLIAVPQHLLGERYQGSDRQAFTNDPYWTRAFVAHPNTVCAKAFATSSTMLTSK